MQQAVAQVPWGHIVLLIEKIKDKEIREIYIKASIENSWSRRVLQMQIETKYHERIGNEINNFEELTIPFDSDLVNKTLKDPYIFDFISLNNNYKEQELEKSTIQRIKDVILELGTGFSFVGNQYKLTVGDKDYLIDLLFYHLKLKCYIVIELKKLKSATVCGLFAY